jgi:hypothetical protein
MTCDELTGRVRRIGDSPSRRHSCRRSSRHNNNSSILGQSTKTRSLLRLGDMLSCYDMLYIWFGLRWHGSSAYIDGGGRVYHLRFYIVYVVSFLVGRIWYGMVCKDDIDLGILHCQSNEKRKVPSAESMS